MDYPETRAFGGVAIDVASPRGLGSILH